MIYVAIGLGILWAALMLTLILWVKGVLKRQRSPVASFMLPLFASLIFVSATAALGYQIYLWGWDATPVSDAWRNLK